MSSKPKELYVVQIRYTGLSKRHAGKYVDWQTLTEPMSKSKAKSLARFHKYNWNMHQAPIFHVWETRIEKYNALAVC